LVEAVVEVGVGCDVEVLGDADGGVAEESGHVLDASAGLGKRPRGEHVAQRVERLLPTTVAASRPTGDAGGGVEHVAPIVRPASPLPFR
jgi:hypothetical protein